MDWYKIFCLQFDELFFGILLIAFGIATILKAIFKFNIPVWPLFGGIALIYAGTQLLVGTANKNWCKKEEKYREYKKN